MPWKSRHRHLSISIDIDVGISIGIVNFFLPFEALSFAFRSFLWSKTSMVKSFSTTFVNLPGSVCCYLEQLFSREVVSACFWRKKLRHGRCLRSFKNTQGWKLQLVCLCILIRNHIRDQFLEIFSFLEKSQNSFKKFR